MNPSSSMISDLNRYIAGDDSAGDPICTSLETPVRETVRHFLGPDDPDGDDLVQDTLLALLGYLRRARIAPDNPEAFVVTVARNRCRNLHVWRRRRHARDIDDMADRLPHLGANPLDLVDAGERRLLLNEALQSLGQNCRRLLDAIYRREVPVRQLQDELELGSVQAVYHRRNVCIKKARNFLNRAVFGCPDAGGANSGCMEGPDSGRESKDV